MRPVLLSSSNVSSTQVGVRDGLALYDAVTTEVLAAPEYYFAEDEHQQYLAKNPLGYCGLGGTGLRCPIGRSSSA